MKNFLAEFSPVEVQVVLRDGLSDGKLLRVQLLPISDKPIAHPDFPKGLRFDRAFAEKLVANFAAYGGRVPLDYLHGSEKGDASPEQGKAAGWFRAVRIEGDEVVGYAEPTPAALSAVEAREYLLASAAITMDWLNPRTGKRQGPTLTSAALTNRPFIRGMAEVAVVDARTVTLSEVPASRPADGHQRPKERSMAAENLRTADPDVVTLSEHQKTLVQLTETTTKLAEAEKAKTAAEAKLSAVETEKVALQEQVKRLEGEKARTAAAAEFDALLREGRVIPAEKDALIALRLSDEKAFKAIVGARPKGMWKAAAKGVTVELQEAEQATKDAGVKLSERANKIAEERKIGFREALSIAMAEDPTLARDGTASEAVRRGMVLLSGQAAEEDSAEDDADDGDEE